MVTLILIAENELQRAVVLQASAQTGRTVGLKRGMDDDVAPQTKGALPRVRQVRLKEAGKR